MSDGIEKQDIGKRIETVFQTIGEFVILVGDTIRFTFTHPFPVRATIDQMVRIGVGSILVSMITSFFTGMVMALQLSLALESKMSGISQFVGAMVSKAMVVELSPVLTALVIAGRIGSAIAAEIGTMEVSEQIDALKTLNTNPVAYLVVPRFWAGVLSLPLLTVIAMLMGILGGGFVAMTVLNINALAYFERSTMILSVKDFSGSLIKSVFFGASIVLVACTTGFKTKGGADGVGKSTTLAVVMGFMLILIGDYFITILLRMIGL
ncbi:MAG: ABC transporter permease [Spirochaetes bacterium]|nr:ABC transporter permease [Spirochaetota bacterium]